MRCLSIGCAQYKHVVRWPRLTHATIATAGWHALIAGGDGSLVANGQSRFLLNPSRDEAEDAIAWLCDTADRGILFFSGHAEGDVGGLSLIFPEAEHHERSIGRLRLADLAKMVRSSKNQELLVVLDSCFAEHATIEKPVAQWKSNVSILGGSSIGQTLYTSPDSAVSPFMSVVLSELLDPPSKQINEPMTAERLDIALQRRRAELSADPFFQKARDNDGVFLLRSYRNAVLVDASASFNDLEPSEPEIGAAVVHLQDTRRAEVRRKDIASALLRHPRGWIRWNHLPTRIKSAGRGYDIVRVRISVPRLADSTEILPLARMEELKKFTREDAIASIGANEGPVFARAGWRTLPCVSCMGAGRGRGIECEDCNGTGKRGFVEQVCPKCRILEPALYAIPSTVNADIYRAIHRGSPSSRPDFYESDTSSILWGMNSHVEPKEDYKKDVCPACNDTRVVLFRDGVDCRKCGGTGDGKCERCDGSGFLAEVRLATWDGDSTRTVPSRSYVSVNGVTLQLDSEDALLVDGILESRNVIVVAVRNLTVSIVTVVLVRYATILSGERQAIAVALEDGTRVVSLDLGQSSRDEDIVAILCFCIVVTVTILLVVVLVLT